MISFTWRGHCPSGKVFGFLGIRRIHLKVFGIAACSLEGSDIRITNLS